MFKLISCDNEQTIICDKEVQEEMPEVIDAHFKYNDLNFRPCPSVIVPNDTELCYTVNGTIQNNSGITLDAIFMIYAYDNDIELTIDTFSVGLGKDSESYFINIIYIPEESVIIHIGIIYYNHSVFVPMLKVV